MAVAFAMILGIGVIDFRLGFEVSLLVFYCVPVCLAVLVLGWKAGTLTAMLSVASSSCATIRGEPQAGQRRGAVSPVQKQSRQKAFMPDPYHSPGLPGAAPGRGDGPP